MPQMNEKNWMIIVAVVIVLIGSLIYNIISARNLKKKRQQFVESIQFSYTHMKSIEDTSKKIYEISNEINEMIREQKDTEEYIEKKKKEIEEIRQMIVTNDTILDCAISDKRDLARKRQIAFTYNIPTGLPEIRMEDVDKIRLFANLLDNAIEAAECVPVQDANGENKRFIHVSILNRGSNFFITVKNSKRTEIAVMENQFHTTKPDAENHGRGVRIIRQIVARYDGTVEFTDKGDAFEVAIML